MYGLAAHQTVPRWRPRGFRAKGKPLKSRSQGGTQPGVQVGCSSLEAAFSPSHACSRDHEDSDLLCLKGDIKMERRQSQSMDTLPVALCSAGIRARQVGTEQSGPSRLQACQSEGGTRASQCALTPCPRLGLCVCARHAAGPDGARQSLPESWQPLPRPHSRTLDSRQEHQGPTWAFSSLALSFVSGISPGQQTPLDTDSGWGWLIPTPLLASQKQVVPPGPLSSSHLGE